MSLEFHHIGIPVEKSRISSGSRFSPAFKTNNIQQVLKGKQVIMPLYEPFSGYKCAMILVNSLPIELIETNLSEADIWENDKILKNGILYGEG